MKLVSDLTVASILDLASFHCTAGKEDFLAERNLNRNL